MDPIRIIDANEFGHVGWSKRDKADFDAKFRRWARDHGQEMPDELLTIEARYRQRARIEQEASEAKGAAKVPVKRKDKRGGSGNA